MKRILITGINGQVGHELSRALSLLGNLILCDRTQLDLNDPDSISPYLDIVKPDIIVNPAAYTAVDKAESDSIAAKTVNSQSPKEIAHWASKNNALFIHYSTDYVFDGQKDTPYTEIDATNPQSVYGKTKLKGEEFIKESGCNHFIFRTSWVVGIYGKNFLKTILRLVLEKEQVSIVNDQFGVPTSAGLIADITAHFILLHQRGVLTTKDYGIYNLAPSGRTNWHEYAQFITKLAKEKGLPVKIAAEDINGIPTSEYPTPAKRPKNSSLDTAKLSNTIKITTPDWKQDIQYIFNSIVNNRFVDY